ncbi:hypothetical protein A2U01_0115521, partial [Trifolium medium]|nr:hypothetical protein [Trifolium medium]
RWLSDLGDGGVRCSGWVVVMVGGVVVR